MSRRYIGAAETAKLVRLALKESFPGTTFSVRSENYSGGCSVDVRWDDGPTYAAVREVGKHFDGTYFDSMIDYAGSVYHKLDGEEVNFGPTVVMSRSTGKDGDKFRAAWDLLSTADREKYYHKTGMPLNRLDERDSWYPAWAGWSFTGKDRAPSATMDRVVRQGDDGYGEGTTGLPEKPATMEGYPRHERERKGAKLH